ncbi:MAG: hypothetical protein AB8I08_33495 [Sandaracinaceae bacterium]
MSFFLQGGGRCQCRWPGETRSPNAPPWSWLACLLVACGSPAASGPTEAPPHPQGSVESTPAAAPSASAAEDDTPPVARSAAPTFAAALVYAQARLSECPLAPDEDWVETASLDPELFSDVRVAAWGDERHVFLEDLTLGTGVDGESFTRVQRVDVATCRAVEVGTGNADGAYFASVSVEPTSTPAEQVAEILGCALLDRSSAEQGGLLLYADMNRGPELRAFEDGAGPTQPRVSPPLFRPQPWFEGEPQPAPFVYDPAEARELFRLDPPVRLRVAAGVELWSAPLRGRNGGFALAQRDAVEDRHRWVFWSRGVLNATEASWGPSGEGVALAYGWSQHPVYSQGEGFFVLDLTRGTAHRLVLPRGLEGRWDLEDAESPEAALRLLGVRWTRTGLRYRDAEGQRALLTVADVRRMIDAAAQP